MDSGIGRSLDRISKLPDSVLSHILSFLPTKYAVGTSILSTRWQYLWASVPNLDFDDSLISEKWSKLDKDRQDELKLSFMNFVDRVLLLSDVTRLQKFHLTWSWEDNFDLVNTWICTAIKRNVVEIYLDYRIENDVKLPHMLFTSKTLAVLILSEGIMIDTPSSVWLPSLKTLHLLSVKYKNNDVAHNLLSGCPVLEELYIDRFPLDGQEILNGSVPTLKLLTIHCICLHIVFDDEDESDEPRHKLVIDAPKLKNLDLDDSLSDDFLMMDLSSLLEANIHVGHTSRRTIQSSRFGGRILKLLRGMANVKFLTVSDLTLSFLTNVSNYVIPTFHNLTHLKLEVNSGSGWKLLMDFLECSPKLEVLVLDKGDQVLHQVICWNPPQRVPNCLLLHLKEVEITEFSGKENELEAIKYLLKYGNMLKKMTIDCRYMKSNEEIRVCKKVAGFPRASKTCPLNLLF